MLPEERENMQKELEAEKRLYEMLVKQCEDAYKKKMASEKKIAYLEEELKINLAKV